MQVSEQRHVNRNANGFPTFEAAMSWCLGIMDGEFDNYVTRTVHIDHVMYVVGENEVEWAWNAFINADDDPQLLATTKETANNNGS